MTSLASIKLLLNEQVDGSVSNILNRTWCDKKRNRYREISNALHDARWSIIPGPHDSNGTIFYQKTRLDFWHAKSILTLEELIRSKRHKLALKIITRAESSLEKQRKPQFFPRHDPWGI